MTQSFRPDSGLIIIPSEVFGPSGTAIVRLAHTLPPSAGVDGLLGLDFFRDHLLSIDFQRGQVSLYNKALK